MNPATAHAESVDPQTLLGRFGLSEFRPGQREVVDAVAQGHDVMCVMPTGGGKSLCYQLPSLARDGTTIVVSPLIALMKDQVDTLRQRKINAKLINSSLSLREQEDVMESMARGELDLVYVAPERLRNGRFLEALERCKVTLLAVDEAHCVSEWGHDFRPDYSRLGTVRQRYLNGLQTIALTATATPTVRDDICQLLGLKEPKVYVKGFARTNLSFGVSQSKTDSEKQTQLVNYVKGQPGAGIVYASTRKNCELIGEWLPEQTRRPIGVYHGGMEPDHRRRVQDQFMSGELDAIVATNAFGMGIDKSDIRFVAHYNMPGTLEAYYQEAGRAGRDGLESDCRLFFSYQDRYIQEFFIENRYPSKEVVKKVYEFLHSRPEDPIELTLEEVRKAIDADSAEAISTSETLLAKAGVLRRLDSSQNQMVVRIESDAPTLLDFLPKEAKLRRRVMTAIERVVGRRRFDDVYVQPNRLMTLAKVERDQLMRTLRELSRLNAFDYIPPFRGRAVHFVRRDTPFDMLEIDFDELARRKASEYEKLESVIGFARTGGCRQRVILDYFGDPESKNCGNCDRCPTAEEAAQQTKTNELTKGLTERDARALLCGLRVVLSGVTRMHGRFGKTMVAQMLCGSSSKKISQWKLQRLSTYGMLSSMKQSQLAKVIDALIDHGLVEQREVDQRRPTIEINDLGKAVMHLKSPLPPSFSLPKTLAKQLAIAAREIESTDVSTGDSSSPEPLSNDTSVAEDAAKAEARDVAGQSTEKGNEFDAVEAVGVMIGLDDLTSPEDKLIEEVSETLKRWRRRTSAALGIPAYRVLTNSTIDRLAELRPESSTELEEVSGVGPATMEQHGYDILELIRTCVREAQSIDSAGDSDPEDSDPEDSPSPEDAFAEIQETPDEATGERSKTSPTEDESETSDSEVQIKADKPRRNHSQHDPIRADARHFDSPPKLPSQSALPTQSPLPTQSSASGERVSDKPVSEKEVYWTWRLFSEGYTMEEVCQIRRLSRADIDRHLAAAAVGGRAVSPTWQS